MDAGALDALMSRIGERSLEQDDLLHTAWMVRSSDVPVDRLFERLVDNCLELLFLELEFRRVVGDIDDEVYALETSTLVSQAREAGLHPPVGLECLGLGPAEADVDDRG